MLSSWRSVTLVTVLSIVMASQVSASISVDDIAIADKSAVTYNGSVPYLASAPQSFTGTGFAGVYSKSTGRVQANYMGHFFGFSAGDASTIATLMQIDVSKYVGHAHYQGNVEL